MKKNKRIIILLAVAVVIAAVFSAGEMIGGDGDAESSLAAPGTVPSAGIGGDGAGEGGGPEDALVTLKTVTPFEQIVGNPLYQEYGRPQRGVFWYVELSTLFGGGIAVILIVTLVRKRQKAARFSSEKLAVVYRKDNEDDDKKN